MVSSVQDAAISLEVLSGFDENDSTTSKNSVDSFSKNLNSQIKGMKIGLIKEFMMGQSDPDVERVFQQALNELKVLGAEIVEVSIPLTEFAVPMYYLISASEASSNLARYDGVKYGYRSNFKICLRLILKSFIQRHVVKVLDPK